MSEGFEKLKEIGAQKIHEQTHIPKEHAESIVNKKFTRMNKIQYLGFISILEREYSIKLDNLRNSAKDYFQDSEEEDEEATPKKLFIIPQRKKSYTKYYILLAIIILIIVAIYNTSTTQQHEISPKIQNEKITQVKQKIVTKAEIPEPIIEEKEEVKEVEITPKVFKIIPNVKLWMGYIDLNTGKKSQVTFSDEFELDPDGHWLIALGHGNVSFEIGNKFDEYKSHKNMRFEYKNGELKKLTYAEFLALNKGKKW